jgi:hypothetical protein
VWADLACSCVRDTNSHRESGVPEEKAGAATCSRGNHEKIKSQNLAMLPVRNNMDWMDDCIEAQ